LFEKTVIPTYKRTWFLRRKLKVETALGNNSASYAHFGHEIVSWLNSSCYAEDIFSEAFGLKV
jgi:hypothetical protein